MKCEICGVDDSEKKIRKIRGRYLCSKHITQLYRNGEILDRTIYDPNEYEIYDGHAEIILRDKKQNIVGRALIDLEDVEMCKQYKWHLRHSRNTDYVITSLPDNKKIHLHRFVMHYDGADDIDHQNHNGLDNRKRNLSVKTHSKNLRNQSNGRNGIKQVPSGRYQAIITVNGKGIYLGTFDNYDAALNARRAAEINL